MLVKNVYFGDEVVCPLSYSNTDTKLTCKETINHRNTTKISA